MKIVNLAPNLRMIDLIDSKQAYACFYSDDRINEINKSEIAKKNAAEYDKKFQMISVNEAKERMETENFVIRLKMPKTGEEIIKDEVKGKLKFDLNKKVLLFFSHKLTLKKPNYLQRYLHIKQFYFY